MSPSLPIVHTFLSGLAIALGPILFWLMDGSEGFARYSPAFTGLPWYDPLLLINRYPGWVVLPCCAAGVSLMAAAWGLHHHRAWAGRSLEMSSWVGAGICAGSAVLLLVAMVQLRDPIALFFHGVGLLMVGFLAVQLRLLRSKLLIAQPNRPLNPTGAGGAPAG